VEEKMKKRWVSTVLVLMAVLLVANVGFAKDDGKAKAAINEMNQTLMNGLMQADAAMIASVYAEDAWTMGANETTTIGATTIGEGMAQETRDVRLTTTELKTADDWAWETGTYTTHDANGMQVDNGKYVAIWMNNGGSWKMYRHIWNSDISAAPMDEEMHDHHDH
jgi:ketosteroid isomerase-like protein